MGCLAILPCSRALLLAQLLESLAVIDPTDAGVLREFVYPDVTRALRQHAVIMPELVEDVIADVLWSLRRLANPHGLIVDVREDGVYIA